MAKPTDGPWYVWHETHVMADPRRCRGMGERLVANCGGYTTNVDSDAVNAENAANARLIAKARHLPALVEALEAVNAVTRIGDDMDFAEAFGAAMHKVRAALALVQDEDHG